LSREQTRYPSISIIVKIDWSQRKNPEAPYSVAVPGNLKAIDFIEKDSKKFAASGGWGYAEFAIDAASNTFKPNVTGTACGYACHTKVEAKDYMFAAYPPR
jgi:hypothetical protein